MLGCKRVAACMVFLAGLSAWLVAEAVKVHQLDPGIRPHVIRFLNKWIANHDRSVDSRRWGERLGQPKPSPTYAETDFVPGQMLHSDRGVLFLHHLELRTCTPSEFEVWEHNTHFVPQLQENLLFHARQLGKVAAIWPDLGTRNRPYVLYDETNLLLGTPGKQLAKEIKWYKAPLIAITTLDGMERVFHEEDLLTPVDPSAFRP